MPILTETRTARERSIVEKLAALSQSSAAVHIRQLEASTLALEAHTLWLTRWCSACGEYAAEAGDRLCGSCDDDQYRELMAEVGENPWPTGPPTEYL